jgi:hypothetical protein
LVPEALTLMILHKNAIALSQWTISFFFKFAIRLA